MDYQKGRQAFGSFSRTLTKQNRSQKVSLVSLFISTHPSHQDLPTSPLVLFFFLPSHVSCIHLCHKVFIDFCTPFPFFVFFFLQYHTTLEDHLYITYQGHFQNNIFDSPLLVSLHQDWGLSCRPQQRLFSLSDKFSYKEPLHKGCCLFDRQSPNNYSQTVSYSPYLSLSCPPRTLDRQNAKISISSRNCPLNYWSSTPSNHCQDEKWHLTSQLALNQVVVPLNAPPLYPAGFPLP